MEYSDVIQMARSLGFRFRDVFSSISDCLMFYKDGKDYFFNDWDEVMNFVLEQSDN